MALTDIPPGERLYVDANIFIYHFAGESNECSHLLERIEQEDVGGITGTTSVIEVTHRLVMLEAIEHGLEIRSNPAARLARKPDLIRRLSKYYFSALSLTRMGIEILPLPAGPWAPGERLSRCPAHAERRSRAPGLRGRGVRPGPLDPALCAVRRLTAVRCTAGAPPI
jgi:hypothetical protein